jgi:GMP synthase-like glutamine amidotransferase
MRRMRALLIQHDHLCHPGFVGERLAERGYAIEAHQVVPEERFHSPAVETEFPDPRNFEVVVVLGAAWSAYDETLNSWLLPELQLIRDADEARVPVLGVCFGGQMLAAAHGGSVALAAQPEIGWYDVQSDDPLVPGGRWFQWHYDRWQLPAGATEIARNPQASQAFVLGRHLAVQFHPELDEKILAGWLVNGGDDDARKLGIDPDTLLADTRRNTVDSRIRAHRLVDAFLTRAARYE